MLMRYARKEKQQAINRAGAARDFDRARSQEESSRHPPGSRGVPTTYEFNSTRTRIQMGHENSPSS